ncbi:MAG: glycosyltransferase [Actinomycetota bacterium]|nr:glycosyltransferase [Actinomycetota bacterium]
MTDHTLSPIGAVDLVALDQPQHFEASDFDLTRLCELKGTTTVSVCLPARDEAETVGPIVQTISTLRHRGLVDEIVVMDDRSTDATAQVAAAAGARVVSVPDVLPEAGTATDKGNVLWASVAASVSDVIVWIDADLRSFTPDYVIGLLGPLLTDPEVTLVKGFYDRPTAGGAGGGRTTELMARPVLATFPRTRCDRAAAGRRVRESPLDPRTTPLPAGLRRRDRTLDRHRSPLGCRSHRPGRSWRS